MESKVELEKTDVKISLNKGLRSKVKRADVLNQTAWERHGDLLISLLEISHILPPLSVQWAKWRKPQYLNLTRSSYGEGLEEQPFSGYFFF